MRYSVQLTEMSLEDLLKIQEAINKGDLEVDQENSDRLEAYLCDRVDRVLYLSRCLTETN